MEKNCNSCGMGMVKPGDFGGMSPDNPYCVYCTDPTGSLKPYDMVLQGFTSFIVNEKSLSEEDAMKMAKEAMHKLPAWKDKGGCC